jgi:hypothetical protein
MLSEKLTPKIIVSINTAAVMLCKGNLVTAKELLEVVLDELEMKVVVNSHESKHILPTYLVSILVYLILKTSKFATFLMNYF